jgi:hypothetical protein
MSTSTETSTTNAERMQRLDDAWNARDWDTFDAYHDGDSVVVYWPGQEDNPTHGGHDHRAEAKRFCNAFPDNRVHNEPYDVLFGDGDYPASSHGSPARSPPHSNCPTATPANPQAKR